MNERLGIAEERQAMRAILARYAYNVPRLADALNAEAEALFKEIGKTLAGITAGADVSVAPKPPPILVKDLPETPNRPIPKADFTAQEVVEAVCEAFGISVRALICPRRTNDLSRARFAAAMLLKDKVKMSYPRISCVLGRRDHTPAINAIVRAKGLLDRDPEWTAAYRAAEHRICRK